MSSVETGQMSAVETGQMSAAATGQMSSPNNDLSSPDKDLSAPNRSSFQLLADFCPRDWSQRLGNAVAFMGGDSQVLATILDPFWTIFVDLGPNRLSATETSTLCVETRQMFVLATEDIYSVSTGGRTVAGRRPAAVMSSVETG